MGFGEESLKGKVFLEIGSFGIVIVDYLTTYSVLIGACARCDFGNFRTLFRLANGYENCKSDLP